MGNDIAKVRGIVVGTGLVGAAVLVGAMTFAPRFDVMGLVVFFVAIALCRASVLNLTRGTTTWSMSLEEAILVPALVLLAPAEFVIARVAAEPVAQLLKRYGAFSPVPRRRPDPFKLVFGMGAGAVGSGVAAVGYAVSGAPDAALGWQLLAAVTATATMSMVISTLVSRVVSLLEGRSWREEMRRDLRKQSVALTMSLWLGAVIAVAAATGPVPLLWPLGSALVLTVVARLAAGRLLDASRVSSLLAAGATIHRQSAREPLEDALRLTAAELLHADTVEVRGSPPEHGEIGVPYIGSWLVASGRSHRDRPFDAHDLALLEGLAAMATTSHHNATLVEQLQAHDRLKSDMLAAVSHDLRTPLVTAAAGLAHLQNSANVPEADRDRLTEVVARSLRRLQRLVEDLLDLQRVEHRVASSAAGSCRPWIIVARLAAEHDLLVSTDIEIEGDDLPVAVEAAWVERVLENVLVNAAKHSPPDAPVRVVIGSSRDGQVPVVVEDAGPGIPPSSRRALLEPFAQADGEQHSGVGLGLYVTKRFVEHAGGRVEIGTSRAGGAAVTVYLPTTPANPDRSPDREDAGSTSP